MNEAGQAVTPVYTYADTRPAKVVDQLKDRFDEAQIHQRTGCIFHPSYLPSRFLWLKFNYPDIFSRQMRWMSVGEYLYMKLFNQRVVSYSTASWTGLLDRRQLDWDDELLDYLEVGRGQLSRLVDLDIAFQGLTAEFAARWPALSNIPWYPVVGDGASANLGSGCVGARQVAITVGTSSAVRVVLPSPVHQVPKGLWCYQVDGQLSLLGGALTEGGNIYAWLKHTLNLDALDQTEDALSGIPPDSHGLTFIPLLGGERSPGWQGAARGMISGITLATMPEDILLAGLESVAYRIGKVYQLLQPSLAEEPLVIGSGGALTNSRLWSQIVADVIGRPLAISRINEASARGVAMLVLRSAGIVPDLEKFPSFTGALLYPNPERHVVYRAAMLRQQRQYENYLQIWRDEQNGSV